MRPIDIRDRASRARTVGGRIGIGKCNELTYIPTDESWARARALLSQRAHDVGQRSPSPIFSLAHHPQGTRVREGRRVCEKGLAGS
eukprot:4344199-Pleurochrysis_carterae.AAC.1